MERNGIKRRIVILRGPLLVAGWLAFPLVGVAICGISGIPFCHRRGPKVTTLFGGGGGGEEEEGNLAM